MAKQSFPKVASVTTIKSCTKKKGGVGVQFNDLNFTGSQFEQISDWIDDDVKVKVTIQQFQGSLLGESK